MKYFPAVLLPLFADTVCHVVSVTDPHSRILNFLDQRRYSPFQEAPQLFSTSWECLKIKNCQSLKGELQFPKKRVSYFTQSWSELLHSEPAHDNLDELKQPSATLHRLKSILQFLGSDIVEDVDNDERFCIIFNLLSAQHNNSGIFTFCWTVSKSIRIGESVLVTDMEISLHKFCSKHFSLR
jgi:hypothetical protein